MVQPSASAVVSAIPSSIAYDLDHRKMLASWYNITQQTNNGTFDEGNKRIPFSEFYAQQITANNVAVAALTLYAWEFITTWPDEIQMYRKRKLSSIYVILFALIRYGTLPALILPAYSVWHDFRNDPKGCLQHQQLSICFVQLIVAIILAVRTVAIWGRHRLVVLYFAFAVPVQFAVSFALLWFSNEALLPNGACMPVPNKNGINTLPWFYLVAMAYDLSTIFLSTFKLWNYNLLGRTKDTQGLKEAARRPLSTTRTLIRQWKSLSPLIDNLLKGGLVYLLVATAFNATNFALEYRNELHAHSFIVLYSPLMCILLQRILLMDMHAMWGKDKHDSGHRERSLVDRVLRDGRYSWQGDEGDAVDHVHAQEKLPNNPGQRDLTTVVPAPFSAHAQTTPNPDTEARHLSLDMNSSSPQGTDRSSGTHTDSTPYSAYVRPEHEALALRLAGMD